MVVRSALGDDVERPRFVATVRGRGYRFIARHEAAANGAVAAQHGPAFIGRDRELSQLRAQLARTLSGNGGGIALVCGEVGVGKTRLLEYVSSENAEQAVFVRPQSPARPLGVFASLLRKLSQREPAARALEDALATIETCETEEIIAAFGRLTQPVIVIMDDLERADPASHELLGALAHHVPTLPLFLIGAYRSGDASPRLASVVAMIRRDPAACSLRLEPFTRSEIVRYLESTLGNCPNGLADKVIEKTRGNPLFVAQLAHALRHSPNADSPSTSALVGGGDMRDAVLAYVSALPSSVVDVLGIAAAIGPSFQLSTLTALLEAASDDIVRELDAATIARVITYSQGEYRFTYPLVCDVLYHRLHPSERFRLHARIAALLEARTGDTSDHRRAGEIARHLLQAAPANDPARALAWAVRAHELAVAAGDRRAATRHARDALAALRLSARPDDALRRRLEAVVDDASGG